MRYMHEKIGKREYVNDTCACVVVIEMINGICLVNGNFVYYMVYVYVIWYVYIVWYGIGALYVNSACVIRMCMDKGKRPCIMCELYVNGALCLIIVRGHHVYEKMHGYIKQYVHVKRLSKQVRMTNAWCICLHAWYMRHAIGKRYRITDKDSCIRKNMIR